MECDLFPIYFAVTRTSFLTSADLFKIYSLLTQMLTDFRLYSAEGKSFPFDDRATGGFGPGEGSACVILKPLQNAIDAGDNIRAIIRNTGTNQDGRTLGISRPSAEAQAALIQAVYKSAQLNIAETAYVEAHGTGTKVGDPIEAAAIASTFEAHVDSTTEPVFIGSAKSNFGHLEGVSGILSLIKATMMLAKGVILPNANFEKANPEIPSIGNILNVRTSTSSIRRYLLPGNHNEMF